MIKQKDSENKGNDHQRQNVLMLELILLTCTKETGKPKRRICILILGLKGLRLFYTTGPSSLSNIRHATPYSCSWTSLYNHYLDNTPEGGFNRINMTALNKSTKNTVVKWCLLIMQTYIKHLWDNYLVEYGQFWLWSQLCFEVVFHLYKLLTSLANSKKHWY